MKNPPQSTWDRDPEGTYRKMMAVIDKDAAHGCLVGSEITRFRNAAGKCYLKAKRRQR
jgi:hypothetical protein